MVTVRTDWIPRCPRTRARTRAWCRVGYGPGVYLPVRPPVAPMLARLTRELPRGAGLNFEPKWDGMRALVFRDGAEVDVRSRHDRPLARYFPEIVAALRAIAAPRFVLDGELLAAQFSALLTRLHPARSRVDRLARETPASYVAFDLLALDGDDLRERPFVERRTALVRLLASAPPPLWPTPATEDPVIAGEWLAGGVDGADGVVVKPGDLRYEPGRRVMLKVKREHTVDCVVAGYRLFTDPPSVASLPLGLYDDTEALRHVGVSSSFPRAERIALLHRLSPLAVPLPGHPWQHGFGLEGGPTGRLRGAGSRWTPQLSLDWVPVRPELVCEVGYDRLDGVRFRHPAAVKRWRTDRDPRSCRLDQLRP